MWIQPLPSTTPAVSNRATAFAAIKAEAEACAEVLNALKSILGILQKFLVDHGALHLFERKNQDSYKENQFANDYPLPVNKDVLLSDCRSPLIFLANQDVLLSDCQSPLNPKGNKHLLYGRDPSFCDPYSSYLSHQLIT